MGTSGLFVGHPGPVTATKDGAGRAAGMNKGIFVALRTDSGEVIYLVFKEDDIDNIIGSDNAAGLLEGANLNKGFAADRGLTVMTEKNTKISYPATEGKQESTFVFTPTKPAYKTKEISFSVTLKAVEDGEQDVQRKEEAAAWLSSVATS